MVQAALGLLTNEIKTFPGELQEERMSDLKGKLTIDQNLHSRHILFKAWALYSIIDFKLSSLRTRTIWLLNLTSDILTIDKERPSHFIFRQIKRIEDFLLPFGCSKLFTFLQILHAPKVPILYNYQVKSQLPEVRHFQPMCQKQITSMLNDCFLLQSLGWLGRVSGQQFPAMSCFSNQLQHN